MFPTDWHRLAGPQACHAPGCKRTASAVEGDIDIVCITHEGRPVCGHFFHIGCLRHRFHTTDPTRGHCPIRDCPAVFFLPGNATSQSTVILQPRKIRSGIDDYPCPGTPARQALDYLLIDRKSRRFRFFVLDLWVGVSELWEPPQLDRAGNPVVHLNGVANGIPVTMLPLLFDLLPMQLHGGLLGYVRRDAMLRIMASMQRDYGRIKVRNTQLEARGHAVCEEGVVEAAKRWEPEVYLALRFGVY